MTVPRCPTWCSCHDDAQRRCGTPRREIDGVDAVDVSSRKPRPRTSPRRRADTEDETGQKESDEKRRSRGRVCSLTCVARIGAGLALGRDISNGWAARRRIPRGRCVPKRSGSAARMRLPCCRTSLSQWRRILARRVNGSPAISRMPTPRLPARWSFRVQKKSTFRRSPELQRQLRFGDRQPRGSPGVRQPNRDCRRRCTHRYHARLRVVLDKLNGRWLVSHFDPV